MKSHLVAVITTKCNFKCKHCLREFTTESRDLPLKTLEQILVTAKLMGIKKIALTGGEPVLHSNFNQLIDLIRLHEFSWSVVTNGSIYKAYDFAIDSYKEGLIFIAISLDGGTNETHDLIRQEGSFSKVIEAVKHYRKKNVFVRLAYTINSKNINEIPLFVQFARGLEVNAIRFGGIIPTLNNKELCLTWAQKVQIYKYIQKINKEGGIDMGFTTSLYACANSNSFCNNLNTHEPAINARGEYIFCCDTIGQGAVLGSLENESFADLYQKGVQTAAWLKDERKRRIENKEFFMGFNSCAFCNELLKDKIRHA